MCQQFLATAVVGAVALSAAGVMTLQIVEPGSVHATDVPASAAAQAPRIVTVADGFADTTVVTPTVDEIAVEGIAPGTVTEADPDAGRDSDVADPALGDGATDTADEAIGEDPPAEEDAPGLAAVSEPQHVSGYATVGVTWDPAERFAEDEITVMVRSERDGDWSPWRELEYHDEHGPDDGDAEAVIGRPGTDPLIVGEVDRVQMKVETLDGRVPEDLQLALIDPGEGELTRQAPELDTADLASGEPGATAAAAAGANSAAEVPADGADGADGLITLSAMKIAPKPQIYSRAQWGANEKLRDSKPKYGSVKAAFIHHTVNANNYTAEQVPALLRSIYAYHTQSRKWADIGYNFLVDRFGRIWEGRYGGVDRAVIGAHTLGYNDVAFAMSAIGNFDIAQPPQAVLDAFASLFAWKLSLHDIPARAKKINLKGKNFKAINGHRDAGSTACPGQYLYGKRVKIRKLAEAIQGGAAPPAAVDPVNLTPIAPPAGMPSPLDKALPAVAATTATPPARVSLAADGWPDLVTVNAAGDIRVVPTHGMLGHKARITAGKKVGAKARVAAVGKVTGTGKGKKRSTLLVTNKKGVTKAFLLEKNGVMKKGVKGKSKAFATAALIIGAGDMDRDGRNDVVVKEKGTQRLLLHRGLGKFQFAAPKVVKKKWKFASGSGGVDLDGDGIPDLLGLKKNGALWFFPGKPGGGFGARKLVARLGASAKDVFTVGSVTRQGHPDIAIRWATGTTTVYAGTGGPRLGAAYGPYPGLVGLKHLTSSQITGDRGREFLGVDANRRVVVVPHNGRHNVGKPLPGNLRVAGVTQVLSVGDWNRDGHADIITREADGDELVLRPGRGNGKFGQGRSLGKGWKKYSRLAAVGDVTGDGFPDLMGQAKDGKPWKFFPGNGNNGIKAPRKAPANLRAFNQVGNARWSQDDSVLVSGTGFVLLQGVAETSALRMANGATSVAYNSYVPVGDANGDGVADVIARDARTGDLWLLPGKASGGFGPRMWVAAGFGGYRLLG